MSQATCALPLLPKHDPSGGSDMCTIKVQLPPGISLLQSSLLTPCNDKFVPLAETDIDTDFQLLNVSIGLIGDGVWGVNFWPYKGKNLTMVYLTITPYYSDGLPGIPGEDMTVRMPICET